MSKTQDRDPPATWEAFANHPSLSKYQSMQGLERWETEALKTLDRESREKKAPLSLDDVVKLLSPYMPTGVSDVERELISGLALSLWGSDHVEAARFEQMCRRRRERGDNAHPFMSFVEVLNAAVNGGAEMGRGSVAPQTIDKNIPQFVVQNPNPARVGYDYMPAKQTRASSNADPRALGSVIRHADAQSAVRASLLGPTEVWLLTMAYIGETVKWEKSKGGRLGKVEKRKRSEIAEMYRARLCQDAGRRVGAAPCPARDTKGKGTHAATCAAHGVSDRSVGERISSARERLITSLVNNAMIPEPMSRQEAAKKKQKVHKPRFRPEPVSYSMGGE